MRTHMMVCGACRAGLKETVMLGEEDEARLADLRFHWDEAYAIECVGGVWQARPLVAPSTLLAAGSEPELRRAIRADYAIRSADRMAGC